MTKKSNINYLTHTMQHNDAQTHTMCFCKFNLITNMNTYLDII